MKTGKGEIGLLVGLLEEAYHRRSWHGTNLRGSIRGLTVDEAAWRPAPKRHNIWEIVVHAAYWKYVVRRRILGEKKGSFPLKGSNWIARPVTKSIQAWKEDVALLELTHRELIEAVATFRPSDLPVVPQGSTVSNVMIITGIASHDLYHAGQVQLLKRLQR